MSIRPVLLLGTEPRIALPIARSLRQRGIPVWVAGIGETANPHSRAVTGYVCLPESTTQAFAATLLELIEKHKFDMLIPISDSALVAISRCYEQIKDHIHVACPPPEILNKVIDKEQTLAAAHEVGIPIPKTFTIPDLNTLEALQQDLPFPLIAKPRHKRKSVGFKVLYFADLKELQTAFRKDPYLGLKAMFQEYCYGVGIGIEVLMHAGEPVVTFQHRRIRELPGTGGVSVLAVAEEPDPYMQDLALKLLRKLAWEGVAMVEFRYDRSQRRAVLMEINGRYWGSIATPLWAGVNFPFYEWQIAHGQVPQLPAHFREGMRARWLTGDFLRLHGVVTGPRDRFQPTPIIKDFLNFVWDTRPPVHDMVFSWSDPMPAMFEGLYVAKNILATDTKTAVRALLPERAIEKLLFYRGLGWSNSLRYWGARMQDTARARRRRLPQLLQRARSVLFLCYGNIMRSPLAAALLEERLPASLRDQIAVESAGLLLGRDGRSDHRTIAIGREHGLDLDQHRSRGVTEGMLSAADVIFVMDYANHATLLSRYPQFSRKTFLFGQLRGGGNSVEIPDPYDGTMDDMRACYRDLAICTDRLISLMADGAGSASGFREPAIPANQIPQREAQ